MNDLFVPVPPVITLETAREFLQKRKQSKLIENFGIALFAALGSSLVFYVILRVTQDLNIFNSKSSFRSLCYLLTAFGLSFLAYAMIKGETRSRFTILGADGQPLYNILLPGGLRSGNAKYFGQKNQNIPALVILYILASGAWAFFMAIRAVDRAAGVSRVSPEAITGMFKTLVERGRRIPYDELAGLAARNPEKCFADLLLLDVAQHLKTEPQGMVIHSHIREKMTGINSSGTDF